VSPRVRGQRRLVFETRVGCRFCGVHVLGRS
jgi:hypothetical protein